MIKSPILPVHQQFARCHDTMELDLKAICVFAATGFFMDDDTFWTNIKCLLPGHEHAFDANGHLQKSTKWFHWHYSPRDISFETALDEYVDLLRTIMKGQVKDHQVILPLSGGLDSRSQALILKDLDNDVQAYSYSFKHGFPEHRISKKIADHCGFSFDAFTILKGYLWNVIDELADINQCYSEFTHPRQMAILSELKQMQGIFSLGHWGDVLFDRGCPEGTSEEDILPLLLKKMVKKSGMELAESLWQTWHIEGDFKSYLIERIRKRLKEIAIDNVSAKVRAFKTSQWAHRWTTTNLSVFSEAHEISLPYYDDRMCQFICTVPEAYLADRKLQLAHLKTDKELSKITWHAHRPFNLNTYTRNKAPYNIPFRIYNKLKREANAALGKPYIQRNWELQFLGKDNDANLKSHLFSSTFTEFIPKFVIQDFYNSFTTKNHVYYSHSVSMLLTLSIWYQRFYKN